MSEMQVKLMRMKRAYEAGFGYDVDLRCWLVLEKIGKRCIRKYTIM